ncbi:APC amino acid permease, partial [Flagelloscypha sp. PMI_526]
GLFSAVFLIFNRTIGTGIYATPSVILASSGSVGLALGLWIVGSLVAMCGSAGLPRSGGEKNFLEYLYRRPPFLATCVYTVYCFILGSPSANSVVLGEYLLNALRIPPDSFNVRFVAWLSLTAVVIIQGIFVKSGLLLQNTLGFFKLLVLSSMAITGILSLLGVPWFQVREEYEQPTNFEWGNFWSGTTNDPNAIITSLYSVMWAYIGYSQVNYVLSEVRDPIRTVKIAAPLGLALVTFVYVAVNISYFAVVSKNDIIHSRTIAAALYFRNLFGPGTERALSVFIAISVLGNLLAGQYTQCRTIQELGREGILPFSSMFASSWPFGAPLTGLIAQYIVSCIFMIAPPASDAYLFLISTASYCLTLVNVMVSLGVLLLYTAPYRAWDWQPPFKAPKIIVIAFFASNLFLATVPLIPPAPNKKVYVHLPYWSHVIVSMALSLIGLCYWYIQVVWKPKRGQYRLTREYTKVDSTGETRYIFRKIPL